MAAKAWKNLINPLPGISRWFMITQSMVGKIGKNLSKPEKGLPGSLAVRFMEKNNPYLEKNAARLCNIQPHHKVLEVGFGPGLGLEQAYSYVKDGSGEVHGTDISDRMRDIASSRLKDQIANGKVHIHSYSVDNMGFDDHTFDSVFHCNCYYFWPNMDRAVSELRRVMIPGGLILAIMNMSSLKLLNERGMMVGNTDPDPYMRSLERHGFKDVTLTENYDKDLQKPFQVITAKSPETVYIV